MNYYFLVSSLPQISIGAKPEIGMEAFVDICAEHLSKSDMAALQAISESEEGKGSHKFLRQLNEKETLLRNAIATARASKLNRDATSFTKETSSYDSHIEKSVADALSGSNPLEKEMAIDKLRCDQIEEATGFNPFSGSAVLAYAAKLKIAERWAKLNRKKAIVLAEEIVNRNPQEEESAKTETEEQQ